MIQLHLNLYHPKTQFQNSLSQAAFAANQQSP